MRNKNSACTKIFANGFIYSLLFCKLLSAQIVEDPAKLKIIKRNLHVPPLEELKTVFYDELSKNYAKVSVEVVDSPDLKEPPFNLAASGLGGMPTLLDVGGASRSHVDFRKDKLYDIKTIVSHLGYKGEQLVIGAATGPGNYLNTESDITANIVLNNPKSPANSHILYIDKIRGAVKFESLPLNETQFQLQGNLFLSKGKPGKVLQVYVQKRINENDFITTMRKAIANRYKNEYVGVGGTFVLKRGKIEKLFHYFGEPVTFPGLVPFNNFYHFNGSAPLVGVGTFASSKMDIDVNEQHFHTFSNHGEGGHYCKDFYPEILEYLGYFLPGEILYRVDPAPNVGGSGSNC